jgi:hypothetical protein
MKTFKRILVVTIAIVLPVATSAQQSNADLNVFWEKFKTAVVKGDKQIVAGLSRFPIGMSYGIRSIKNKPELLRRYREVFDKQSDAAKCFAAKEPEIDPNNSKKFSIACPDAAGNEVVIFEFERQPAGWRFVRLDNINE